MTRKMIAYLAAGLFLAGVTGIAQAEGYYNAREDCCTEGFPYYRTFQGPAVPTKVVLDQGNPYIEGMGFAPSAEGQKTVVPKISDSRDWCCEDMSDEEIEMHFQKANIIKPAAGN